MTKFNTSTKAVNKSATTFLTAQNLTLAYTSTPLFQGLTFTVQRGDKIGLIGHNGCGKSSLLKLLNAHNSSSNQSNHHGNVSKASNCLMSYVEQHIPESLQSVSVLNALAESLDEADYWRAELLMTDIGFTESDWQMPVSNCSGGQQMRLLLARAIINKPDLLLLDEPSNHLDLPSLLWLERFLTNWKGSFILVSHDDRLLDSVSNTTWIMRDQSLYHYSLPCTLARQALVTKDEQDHQRHASEQKEIDRIDKSAKRLANWGRVYDNEDLSRKAKTMFARKERLKDEQTDLGEGTPWQLILQGDALPANRLLEITPFKVCPARSDFALFTMSEQRLKSGDRVAILGSNGSGKSTLLNLFYQLYIANHNSERNDNIENSAIINEQTSDFVTFHNRCRLGYYDQSLEQISDEDILSDALRDFTPLTDEQYRIALISAGFEFTRHGQKVASLSGGERARLLFIGLTLARYHLLFLDEPTNHLDMEGKEELIATLNEFNGATLLVSHDRKLIEQACNRFWLINEGKLEEYDSAKQVYQKLTDSSENEVNKLKINPNHADDKKSHNLSQLKMEVTSKNVTSKQLEEEQLLERLVKLETLLENDLKRKQKHQKIVLQQQWQAEIEQIEELL